MTTKNDQYLHQGRLRLDTLLLRENDITVLTPGAFLNFEYINHTRFWREIQTD